MSPKGNGFTFSTTRKKTGFKVISAIGLFLLLLMGCNSSSSSSDDPKPDTKKAPHQDSVKYAVASLNDENQKADAMSKGQDSVNSIMPNSGTSNVRGFAADDIAAFYSNLGLLMGASGGQLGNGFACGTSDVSVDNGVSTVTFSADNTCGDINGSMSIVVNPAGSIDFTYNDFTNAECTINGGVSYNLANVNDENAGLTIAYNNLSVCGEVVNGSFSLTTNSDGTYTYNFDDTNYSYTEDNTNVSVTTSGISLGASGQTSGSVNVKVGDNEAETVTFSNVSMDTSCGVPTAGSLTVGDSVAVDFSSTTCENPNVSYTVDGDEYTVEVKPVTGVEGEDNDNPPNNPDGPDAPGPDTPAGLDISGMWQGSVTFSGDSPQTLHMQINQSGATASAAVEIDEADGVTDVFYDEDASVTIEGTTVAVNATSEEGTVYIFSGIIENNEYSGSVTVDGVANSGTFSIQLGTEPGGPDEPDTPAVDMNGVWQGTVTIRGGDPDNVDMVISQNGNVIDDVEIDIDHGATILDRLVDDDASGTVNGTTVTINANFDEDMTTIGDGEVPYTFTGTVDNGSYSGSITINGEENLGTFSIQFITE